MTTKICAAAIAALPLLSGCVIKINGWDSYQEAEVWVEETEKLQVNSADLEEVACKVHNGAIRVSGGEDSMIEITVRKKAGGADDADARACMAAIDILQEESGDTLSLGWEWGQDRESTWHGIVSFEVEQPAGLGVTARSHNGPVHVDGVEGGIHLSTHNGAVQIEECVGEAKLQTHNAPISGDVAGDYVEVSSHNGAIDLRVTCDASVNGNITTHNAPISLRFGGQPSARVNCKTHNGGISVGGGVRELSRSRREVVAEVGQGEGRIELKTHNGSISIDRGDQ